MVGECPIGKSVEECFRDLLKVLSRNFPGRTEEEHKTTVRVGIQI